MACMLPMEPLVAAHLPPRLSAASSRAPIAPWKNTTTADICLSVQRCAVQAVGKCLLVLVQQERTRWLNLTHLSDKEKENILQYKRNTRSRKRRTRLCSSVSSRKYFPWHISGLPLGLSLSPRVFVKCVDIAITANLSGWLATVGTHTAKGCGTHTDIVLTHLADLGVVVNRETVC